MRAEYARQVLYNGSGNPRWLSWDDKQEMIERVHIINALRKERVCQEKWKARYGSTVFLLDRRFWDEVNPILDDVEWRFYPDDMRPE
jgi:hypothetical protein